MTTKACGKRPHTPIVSESQRGMMGGELKRRREGKKGRMPGMSEEELERHLREAGGKDLPEYSRKSRKGSGVFTDADLKRGYVSLKD